MSTLGTVATEIINDIVAVGEAIATPSTTTGAPAPATSSVTFQIGADKLSVAQLQALIKLVQAFPTAKLGDLVSGKATIADGVSLAESVAAILGAAIPAIALEVGLAEMGLAAAGVIFPFMVNQAVASATAGGNDPNNPSGAIGYTGGKVYPGFDP